MVPLLDWSEFARKPPPAARLDAGGRPADSVVFQLLDVDCVPESECVRFRLFGATAAGHSVCCSLLDYEPYMLVEVPAGFRSDQTAAHIAAINAEVKSTAANYRGTAGVVKRIEEIRGASLLGFREHTDTPFLKVFIRFTALYWQCQQAMEVVFGQRLQFYETNLDFELRFMIDHELVGCGWVECLGDRYTMHEGAERSSHCQIDISTTIDGLRSHAPTDDAWSEMAPLRLLSFDIECSSRPDHFPEPLRDSVLQIGCVCRTLGAQRPFARVAFVRGGCSPIEDVRIVRCDTEEELLLQWARFVRAVDPDFVCGYNIHAFDFPFVIDRLNVLRNPALKSEVLRSLSRVPNALATVRNVRKNSKEKGSRVYQQVRLNGRIVLDVYWVIRKEYPLRSHTLNNVSYHFLGEQKEEVEYKNIVRLHEGGPDDRRRLALYCLKDADLPLLLLEKLMVVINYAEMSRVCGVLLQQLINQGQQIRIVFQLLRKAKPFGFFLPAIDRSGMDDTPCEGGLVMEPVRGFYQRPICVLDFASLYPTLMIAHNLCYTTLLPDPPPAGWIEGVDFVRAPSGFCFVSPQRRRGILPQIMTDLLAARREAKRLMRETEDPVKKSVLNGRQLALKISANSIYGFTGATGGRLYCKEIAESVAAYGRQMIERTKRTVEERYAERNTRVLYGDTDSVMVDFGVPDVRAAMEIGRDAAAFISASCPPPVRLEFEKVYFPFLLIQKKRYAGVSFTSAAEAKEKIETKGLETIRRDNCPLVGVVMNRCMELILLEQKPEEALEFAKQIISELLRNEMDVSMLIITKELKKTNEQYQMAQPHAFLAQRMRQRDPSTAPKLGDRVPFVFVVGDPKSAAHERAEDPIFVLRNRLPIDTQYYLRAQLLNPLIRIFDPLTDGRAERILTEGNHARVRVVPISKTVGIGRFANKKRETCLQCKALVRGHPPPPLCRHCAPKMSRIYTRKMLELRTAQHRFARLWTECQNCAADFTNEVQCGATDCRLFFMREKARVDLEEATRTIRRFDWYERPPDQHEVITLDEDEDDG
ncbi:DNA polymerase [Aphelenchoides fujianensis]|nr:DNA polymerase [Aphelenchoides fujianensis]